MNLIEQQGCATKTDKIKAVITAAKEMSKDDAALLSSLRSVRRDASATKQLWKSENKPFLIKAGISLVLLPEPVTTVVGGFFLAAGTVQEGIKRQGVYAEDLPKAIQNVMRDLKTTKDLL